MTTGRRNLALALLGRVSQARVMHQGRIDTSRIDGLFPSLRDDLVGQQRAELAPYYERYVKEVSSPKRAVSLELATFLSILCERMRPRRVIDFGSGFSSFVLRRYQATATQRPEVWSIEGHPKWLEKTSEFLLAQGLPVDGLLTFEEFAQMSPGQFDLVFADSFRDDDEPGGDNYSRFVDILAQHGLLVLDDFQKRSYRSNAYRALRGSGLVLVVLSEYLRDSFGRFPALVGGPGILLAPPRDGE